MFGERHLPEGREEPLGIVDYERRADRNLRDPSRQGLVGVEMDFTRAAGREVVAETLQFKGGPRADGDRQVEQTPE